MQGLGTERATEEQPRRAPNRRERRRAKQILAWLLNHQEPEPETAEQKAAREAEERQEWLIEFWNGIPISERRRFCEIGGIFEPKPDAQIEPMPLEVIKKSNRIYQ